MIWLKKNKFKINYYCGPRNRQIDDWIDHNNGEEGLIFSYSRETNGVGIIGCPFRGNKIGPVLYSVKKIPHRLKKGDTKASEES